MPTMTNNDNDTNRLDTAPADRDWFGGRRWTGIAAVGFLIVIALCVVVVVVINRGGGNANNAAGGTSSITALPSSSPSSTGSAPAAALPTIVPTTAPAGVIWSIYQTVALPSLPGTGPAKVAGAIATGYAHTPVGALLATANESYRYLLADDATWRRAASEMVAPGAGYNAWLKTRAAHPYGPGGAAGGGGSLAQIAGFQFVSYTPSDAVIQIVTKDSDGNLQVGIEHVSWVGGDWRYVLAHDGSQLSNVQTIDSLTGFIEWRGV